MLANKARTRRFNERLMWMCVTIAQRNDLCRAQAKQRTALEQLRIQVAYNFHSKKKTIFVFTLVQSWKCLGSFPMMACVSFYGSMCRHCRHICLPFVPETRAPTMGNA